MSVSIVARRSARAILDLGVELGSLDAIVDEVSAFASAWETSPELRNAIENPLVAHAAKKAVIGDQSPAYYYTGTCESVLREKLPTLLAQVRGDFGGDNFLGASCVPFPKNVNDILNSSN